MPCDNLKDQADVWSVRELILQLSEDLTNPISESQAMRLARKTWGAGVRHGRISSRHYVWHADAPAARSDIALLCQDPKRAMHEIYDKAMSLTA